MLFSSGDAVTITKTIAMFVISGILFYLAISKKFEPLLLLPIAFGMFLTNFPGAEMFHMDMFMHESLDFQEIINKGGMLDFFYIGVKTGIYPSLIFLGVGAMTDFSPLIAAPRTMLLGAAAQFGVFATMIGSLVFGFGLPAASAIGIIGGADGPTSIIGAKNLAPDLLGPIVIAAYSYMALIPLIQPPIMKLLTTRKERLVRMDNLRSVSKTELMLFPIIVTFIVILLVPAAAPLMGMMMFGNLMNVSGVVDRISKTAQNGILNVSTIFLGLSVGATATADRFLNVQTLFIIALGLAAFMLSTAGGVLFGKLMYLVTKGKVNPLIGSAGVSAMPMAARVSQVMGQKEDPSNFLLMHAMGPNVAGSIGSVLAAGVLFSYFT
ncbi:MAG: sodium ion-translocating decarboxylase subunit beta [Oscillospiraceae bacterium]|nr:sodium ion-translocating decarboxylase subunit beta [Oscillospiraceae bacterium]